MNHLDEKAEVQHIEKGSSNDELSQERPYVSGTVEEARLVRKIDRHMLPMLWVMYIFNYLDRTNIGNAKVGGMQKDLKLTSSDYSLVLSIFFVPSIFLPTIMVLWGGMSVGAKGINTLGGMVAFRMVLGLVEAGFFPGVMLLMSCWYKPAELSKRVAFFYTASLMSGAFGGLLAGGLIEGLEGVGNTRGWKCEDEKWLATTRLMAGAEATGDISHRGAFMAAVKDPKTYVFMLIYNVLNIMTVPIYAVAFVVTVSAGWFADRTGQKAYTVLVAACVSVISFVICAAVHNNAARYAMICFGGAGIWTCIPIFLSWMVTMFDGREKRAVSIALINGVGNLASVYGSFFWPAADAPRYVKGFSISTSLMALAAAIVAFAKWKYSDRGVAGIPRR
ncbi:hypothetical protein IAU60_001204 [Kwoniella sp. DSM 27419]